MTRITKSLYKKKHTFTCFIWTNYRSQNINIIYEHNQLSQCTRGDEHKGMSVINANDNILIWLSYSCTRYRYNHYVWKTEVNLLIIMHVVCIRATW